MGAYSNFGLGIEWPKDFEGRFTAGTEKAVLMTTAINPVVAIRPTPGFSFSMGPVYQYIDIEMRNSAFVAAPAPPLSPGRNLAQTVDGRLRGKDWAWGWHAGFLYEVAKTVSVGAAYKSEVKHNLNDGTQHLFLLSDGSRVGKQGARATFTTPAVLNMGVAYRREPWTVEFDGQWTEWSTYRQLLVDFDNGTTLRSDKRWRNTWTLRLGGQYALNQYLDLRAGIIWDQSPVPRATLDPLLPAGNRWIYSGGLGIRATRKLTIDLSYSYLEDQDKRWNNASGDVKVGDTKVTRVTGTFKDTSAHILTVSTSYKF